MKDTLVRSLKTESEKEMRGISNEMHNRLAAIDLLVRSIRIPVLPGGRKATAIDHTTAYLRPAEDAGNHDQDKGLNENPQRTSIPSVMLTQPAPSKRRHKNK